MNIISLQLKQRILSQFEEVIPPFIIGVLMKSHTQDIED